MAREAAEKAWCPYSKFHVGAAVMWGDVDHIATGCNIENASYGLTICAERTAIFRAVATYNVVNATAALDIHIAVTCPDGDPSVAPTVMPCGACRQVMAEFGVSKVYVDNVGDFDLSDLLPVPFIL